MAALGASCAGGAVHQFAAHERTMISGFGVLLAAVMTWPTILHPASTIPQDIYDPLLQTWQVAWTGHALRSNPLHLWDTNTLWTGWTWTAGTPVRPWSSRCAEGGRSRSMPPDPLVWSRFIADRVPLPAV